MIEIRELRKIFRNALKEELEVLRDISFIIERGAITSVVGPNGCGKTTLLRVIGGIIEPDNGNIYIDGIDIKNTPLKLGYIPQKLALFSWLTAYENVAFPLELASSGITNVSQRKEAVEHILKIVGLWDFRNYFPSQLSGGMQQKLALARGLVTNPDVLLLDEPFAALDFLSRDQFNSELLQIWETLRPTMILVTHDIREAIRLSRKVIIFSARPASSERCN